MSWTKWQPSADQPWDIQRVSHLWRRTGFMPDWATIQWSLREGVEATIQRILSFDSQEYPAFEELATTIGDAAVGADSADRLRAWWIYRMVFTPHPLQERLTLLWHNHFATSNDKVRDVGLMYEQNNLLRQHCQGNFAELLTAVTKHPAMLVWLDADSNRKEHPNENLARELLELFTLGEGNYSETDIPEAARCLTGWTVVNKQFAQVERFHDAGRKELLGTSAVRDGDALLKHLSGMPATARRVVWRLCEQLFASEQLADDAIDQLAAEALSANLNIAWILNKILHSEEFFAPSNIRSRIASPAEYIVGPIRALEMQRKPPSTLILSEHFRIQGQDLFHPPNVFGWNGGRDWINTRSILARQSFAAKLLEGKMHQLTNQYDVTYLPDAYSVPTGERGAFFERLLLGSEDGLKTEASASEQELLKLIAGFVSGPISQLV